MTGWMPDVVPDAPIESAWGNKIRNRTMVPFNTTAERDGYITTPVVGMECYVTATDSIYYYNGTKWIGRPRFRIGYVAQTTTVQTAAINTWTDLLSLTVTPMAETRLCRLNVYTTLAQVTNAANLYAQVLRDGAVISPRYIFQIGITPGNTVCGYYQQFLNLAAVATTFKVQMLTSAQQARCLPNDTTNQSYILVDDLGTP
jgi:hypothetical protein